MNVAGGFSLLDCLERTVQQPEKYIILLNSHYSKS